MATKKAVVETVRVSPPNIKRAEFTVVGGTAFVQNAFPEKARQMMMEKQKAGSTAKAKRTREAKDFDQCYQDAMHRSRAGWVGIPCAAFRNALISACRLVGYKMTLAKLSIFVDAQGVDAVSFQPLVKINGEPEMLLSHVRNATGVADIRARPAWAEWSATFTVSWDADQFTVDDVANLLMRAGLQVGIGEGRNDSKQSNGLGWGTFNVAEYGNKRKEIRG